MRKITFTILAILCIVFPSFSQFDYMSSKEHPFGQYNPVAPEQLKDYEDLIGLSKCTSESRKPDGTWRKPVKMTWRWKYIMNGNAVQDETLKEDGAHSGSIRQYDKDSLQWNVHYYSSVGITSPLKVWKGNKTKKGDIVLYKNHTAPNGTEGFYRLTFYEISKTSYKWVGEWVDKSEKIVYPTWKISCTKEDN